MKYFVVSDLHSCLDPLLHELNKFKFNKKKDTLIVNGDVFDRGEDTVMLYKYLSSLPHLILVRGNHEELFIKLLSKNFPDSFDFSNGTVKTFCHIANVNPDKLSEAYYVINAARDKTVSTIDFDRIQKTREELWLQVRETVRQSEIAKWIKSNAWHDYFEMDNFIITHAFIPVKFNYEDRLFHKLCRHWSSVKDNFAYNPDWREAGPFDWSRARWIPAHVFCESDIYKETKTLVVGHFHTCVFREWLDENYTEDNTTYINNKYNFIGLDAKTCETWSVNVLVINGKNDKIIDYTHNKKLKKVKESD